MINPADDYAALARLYGNAESVLRIGAWECDIATDQVTWTPGVYDMFDIPRGAHVDRRRVLDLYDDVSRANVVMLRTRAVETGASFALDTAIVLGGGVRRWVRLTAQVDQQAGRAVRLFGGKQDVTDERLQWDRLRLRAERDALTGLANRDLFEQRLRRLLAGENPVPLAALVLVDIDHFKRINDCFGHAAGDHILGETARRLSRVFAGALLVSRIGGDEFAVLLGGPMTRAQLRRMAFRAVRSLERPAAWHGQPVALSASIGIAPVKPPLPATRDGLFAEADAALYAVKTTSRGTYRIADEPVPSAAISA